MYYLYIEANLSILINKSGVNIGNVYAVSLQMPHSFAKGVVSTRIATRPSRIVAETLF